MLGHRPSSHFVNVLILVAGFGMIQAWATEKVRVGQEAASEAQQLETMKNRAIGRDIERRQLQQIVRSRQTNHLIRAMAAKQGVDVPPELPEDVVPDTRPANP